MSKQATRKSMRSDKTDTDQIVHFEKIKEFQSFSDYAAQVNGVLRSLQDNMAATRDYISDEMEECRQEMAQFRTGWKRETKRRLGWSGVVSCMIVLAGVVSLTAIVDWHIGEMEQVRIQVVEYERQIEDYELRLEKARQDLGAVQENIRIFAIENDKLERINESLSFLQGQAGSELYLKVGWTTRQCILANGDRVSHCIRRK